MTLVVEDSDVNFNRTYGKGGGVYLTELGIGSAPHVTSISGSYLLDNTAAYDPLAPPYAPSEASGGGLWAGAGADVTITQTTLTGNRADRVGGGLVAQEAGLLTLQDSTVSFNTTGQHGGGAYLVNADADLIQNTIYGNAAGHNGGGIVAYSFLQNKVTISHSSIRPAWCKSCPEWPS